jgi:hypothetical protein
LARALRFKSGRSRSLAVASTTLWAPKLDLEDWQTDDAFAESDEMFGVADGATESFMSGHWARALVEQAVQARDLTEVDAIVDVACADWQWQLERYRVNRESDGRPLKYYEEPNFLKGSHATLLVVQVYPRQSKRSAGIWRAIAVGDSCVYQVSAERAKGFPYDMPEDFNTRPDLISSLTHERQTPVYKCFQGAWTPGDRLFLLTDALALWFSTECLANRKPWSVLWELDNSSFREWVDVERRGGHIRDDDITLTRLALAES